jgi:hypothetical protein
VTGAAIPMRSREIRISDKFGPSYFSASISFILSPSKGVNLSSGLVDRRTRIFSCGNDLVVKNKSPYEVW